MRNGQPDAFGLSPDSEKDNEWIDGINNPLGCPLTTYGYVIAANCPSAVIAFHVLSIS
ncbi:MAG: hypothetical protein Q9P44_06065 [Anaerolineae bacterium]|nr:hypothetical protein [Anaerolineae bacterium]